VRTAHLTGLGKAGMVSSFIVTGWLILLRRRDQAIMGGAACHWERAKLALGIAMSSRATELSG
jgi:hypothetical protein